MRFPPISMLITMKIFPLNPFPRTFLSVPAIYQGNSNRSQDSTFQTTFSSQGSKMLSTAWCQAMTRSQSSLRSADFHHSPSSTECLTRLPAPLRESTGRQQLSANDHRIADRHICAIVLYNKIDVCIVQSGFVKAQTVVIEAVFFMSFYL